MLDVYSHEGSRVSMIMSRPNQKKKFFQSIQLNDKFLLLKGKHCSVKPSLFSEIHFRNSLKVNHCISYLLSDITTSYLDKTYLLVKNNLRQIFNGKKLKLHKLSKYPLDPRHLFRV